MSDNNASDSSSSLFWAALSATVDAVPMPCPMPTFVLPTVGPLTYVPPQYAGAAAAAAGGDVPAFVPAFVPTFVATGMTPTAPAPAKKLYPDGTPKKRRPLTFEFGTLETLIRGKHSSDVLGRGGCKRQRQATEEHLLSLADTHMGRLKREEAVAKALAKADAEAEAEPEAEAEAC